MTERLIYATPQPGWRCGYCADPRTHVHAFTSVLPPVAKPDVEDDGMVTVTGLGPTVSRETLPPSWPTQAELDWARDMKERMGARILNRAFDLDDAGAPHLD